MDNIRTFKIDGSKCETKENLLKEFKNILQIPDYFGYNWDAFEEAVNDFEWLGSVQGIQIIISKAELLLCREGADEIRTLCSILDKAEKNLEAEELKLEVIYEPCSKFVQN